LNRRKGKKPQNGMSALARENCCKQGDCKKALIYQWNRETKTTGRDERRGGVQGWTTDRPEHKKFTAIDFERQKCSEQGNLQGQHLYARVKTQRRKTLGIRLATVIEKGEATQ